MMINNMKVTKRFKNRNDADSDVIRPNSNVVIYRFRDGDAMCEIARLIECPFDFDDATIPDDVVEEASICIRRLG